MSEKWHVFRTRAEGEATHDGHTLLVAVNSLVSEIPHVVKLRIDMAREIKPLAELARGGLVLVGHPSFPAKNLAELIAYVKGHPGQVNVASYSTGTLSHLLKVLQQPAVRDRMPELGFDVGLPRSVDEMVSGLRADHERVGTLLKSIGFKPE